MNRIIYYFGAGASYGRKEVVDEGTENEHLIIHEGLPIVNEITKSLLSFKMALQKVHIEDGQFYVSYKDQTWLRHQNKGSDINLYKKRLLEDIDIIYKASIEHATIDTYAKKLFLTNKEERFMQLKNVLSVFFVWVQLEGKPDQRYDTFLANILQKENLKFPKDISVISWNYDSQFEIAYRNYNENDTLPIYEKKKDGKYPPLKDFGGIFKVNGSAIFDDSDIFDSIIKEDKETQIIQLIQFYEDLYVYNSALSFQLYSHLSFAWEISDKQNQLMNAINQTTVDTESVVVIGYSFPFFNREIDRIIFAGMPNLKTIYIQDPNPDAVEQSLRAVLPIGCRVNIEHQKDCTQFYLPREL